jgi:hypothetical protein
MNINETDLTTVLELGWVAVNHNFKFFATALDLSDGEMQRIKTLLDSALSDPKPAAISSEPITLTGEVHWLHCEHPLCVARWEGTSLEADYDDSLDEYICPACGGVSAVRDRGLVPESVFRYAAMTADEFYTGGHWKLVSAEMPWARKDELHEIIVRTALAAGHRLPVAVLPDYPDVIAALSETTGTYLNREPGWDVILDESDETFFVLERAASGEWPQPITPSDFMAWFADEAEIQRDQVEGEHDAQEIKDRLAYADKLDTIVGRLAAQGITPGVLPWQQEIVA